MIPVNNFSEFGNVCQFGPHLHWMSLHSSYSWLRINQLTHYCYCLCESSVDTPTQCSHWKIHEEPTVSHTGLLIWKEQYWELLKKNKKLVVMCITCLSLWVCHDHLTKWQIHGMDSNGHEKHYLCELSFSVLWWSCCFHPAQHWCLCRAGYHLKLTVPVQIPVTLQRYWALHSRLDVWMEAFSCVKCHH